MLSRARLRLKKRSTYRFRNLKVILFLIKVRFARKMYHLFPEYVQLYQNQPTFHESNARILVFTD